MTRVLFRVATAALLSSSVLGYAQTAAPPPPGTIDGARPGNDIGTGMSLPRSDRASNIGPADTRSELAPNLPAPAAGEGIAELLAAARSALLGGQSGAAQEALERAETRILDRSVDYGAERVPARNALVASVAGARADLGRGDTQAAVREIDGALAGMR